MAEFDRNKVYSALSKNVKDLIGRKCYVSDRLDDLKYNVEHDTHHLCKVINYVDEDFIYVPLDSEHNEGYNFAYLEDSWLEKLQKDLYDNFSIDKKDNGLVNHVVEETFKEIIDRIYKGADCTDIEGIAKQMGVDLTIED